MAKFARDGYAYFQVETPSVFCEMELPIREDDYSPEEEAQHQELMDLAEAHGTYVKSTPYQRG
jgi:hypothetical protein